MKKTLEIYKALTKRDFINKQIKNQREVIEKLKEGLSYWETEKKILNFELLIWDKFEKSNDILKQKTGQ